MSIEDDLNSDADILARGLPDDEGEKVKTLIRRAFQEAKAGTLAAAAESLESVRGVLVARDHFRSYDNDIWVFVDIIERIRHQSPEQAVPSSYRRLLGAAPSARMDEDMSPALKTFWYGKPDVEVGGEIRLVPANSPDQLPKSNNWCFIATAACGSPTSWEVEALRAFRDRSLLPTWGGRLAVEAYYRVSPPLARWIEARAGVRGMVRRLLIAPLALALGGKRSVTGRT